MTDTIRQELPERARGVRSAAPVFTYSVSACQELPVIEQGLYDELLRVISSEKAETEKRLGRLPGTWVMVLRRTSRTLIAQRNLPPFPATVQASNFDYRRRERHRNPSRTDLELGVSGIRGLRAAYVAQQPWHASKRSSPAQPCPRSWLTLIKREAGIDSVQLWATVKGH